MKPVRALLFPSNFSIDFTGILVGFEIRDFSISEMSRFERLSIIIKDNLILSLLELAGTM